MDSLTRILGSIFRPPPMPPIEVPLWLRATPGARKTIAEAFVAAYARGVMEGFAAGVVVMVVLIVLVLIRRSVPQAGR